MNIAEFAVSRPVAVIMRIAALVLLGAICLTRLPVDLLPKVTLPTVVVSTSWPNVAAEEIETEITRRLEETLSTVPNLDQISSTSSEGGSSVRVQFQWGTDIGQAAVDVLQLVSRASRAFPSDSTLQTPTIFKFDPNQQPILSFGVSGEDDPVKLRTILDDQISPLVESADGVAAVNVSGGLQRTIRVDVDPVRLRAHHLALADLMRRIMQENQNLPAGIARHSNTEYTIRSLGTLASLDELKALPISTVNGQVITLQDVADVRDAHDERRIFTRLNGKPSCGLSVTKQSGANTITTAKAVFERLDQAKKAYPNLDFAVAYDQAEFIKHSIDDVRNSALIGGVLAILILLFFLRNVRSTLVVALSIPTSIISTFALLYMCGFSINTMSLGGLALATGLIVDDAVVVLENIFRHIERDKKTARQAAVGATKEIMSAVVASTWTVMVVFLPLLLIRGQAGQMFTQFALVVIFSLAVSLLDATTVVPMLATRLISGEAHSEELANASDHPSLLKRAFHRFGLWFEALDNTYRNGLRWTLHHRWWTIGGALAITLASLLLYPMLGTELMPPTDSGNFNVNIRMPIGTAVEETNKMMQQVEGIIMKNESVETIFATAGGGGRGGGGGRSVPNQGSVSVRLKDKRKQTTQQVIEKLRGQLRGLPGATARLNQFDIVATLMSGGSRNVEINIFGSDLGTLSDLGREAMSRVRDIRGYENVDVNWQDAMPEVQWRVDRVKASQLGVIFTDVASTINTSTNGSQAGYFREKGFQYPIIVQVPANLRKTVDQMKGLVVTSNSGANMREVVLSQVATPTFAAGPSQITRLERQRFIAVSGLPQGRSENEVQDEIKDKLKDMDFPAGYYWDWGANQKRRGEEFGGMKLAVILAIGLIYMLLASQFESLIHPLTILLSVPLSASGVIVALFLTDRTFGLTAYIGVLMLVGIVVKNGILLVDYTNVLRDRGIEREKALLTAGPTRLRPILMTASCAVLGMLPLALGIGKGSEIQAPMATAVIGGLCTSTILTLFIIPVVYSVMDDIASAIHLRRAQQNGRLNEENVAVTVEE
ncbi:MAG: efflux RND transporter permease subunit [Armatimonadota bacterium]